MEVKVKRMALSGSVRGSVIISETDGGARVSLHPARGARSPEGLWLITLGERGAKRVPLSGAETEAGQGGVYALGLAEKGRLVSFGMSAYSGGRERALERLRLEAACSAHAAAGDPFREKRTAPKPGAPVTQSILEQARRLFAAASAAGEKAPGKAPPERDEGGEWERIPNPFPRTYPGAQWARRPGEQRLTGRFGGAGGELKLTALPAQKSGGRYGGRTLISKDGRKFTVFAEQIYKKS